MLTYIKDLTNSFDFDLQQHMFKSIKQYLKYKTKNLMSSRLVLNSSNDLDNYFYLLSDSEKSILTNTCFQLNRFQNQISFFNSYLKQQMDKEVADKNILDEIDKHIMTISQRISNFENQIIKPLPTNRLISLFTIFDEISFNTNSVAKMIKIRQIMTDKLKDVCRKFDTSYDYIVVPELSKNYHLHFHTYIIVKDEIKLNEIIEDLMIRIKLKLKKENILHINLHSKIMLKDDYIITNYVSPLNNIQNKMTHSLNFNKLLYFGLVKSFKGNFLTHSRLKIPFSKMRRLLHTFAKFDVINSIKNIFKLTYKNIISLILGENERYKEIKIEMKDNKTIFNFKEFWDFLIEVKDTKNVMANIAKIEAFGYIF